MLRAILPDMGGTLDGDGLHWLDRFERRTRTLVLLPHDTLRAAFDEAERLAAVDETIATVDPRAWSIAMRGWQLQHLPPTTPACAAKLVARFVKPRARHRARESGAACRPEGAACSSASSRTAAGMFDRLCDDPGTSPFRLSSTRSRPLLLDPAIFLYASARLSLPSSSIMMVGDSFDRDVRPAIAVGGQTAWLEGPAGRDCPDRALADVSLRALADLPEALDRQARIVA